MATNRYSGIGISSNSSSGRTSTAATAIESSTGSNSFDHPSRARHLSPLSTNPTYLGPAFNACASSSSNLSVFDLDVRRSFSGSNSPPTLASILRGRHGRRSPLSPMGNLLHLQTPPSRSPPVYKTPVKVVDEEEDVIVMDGVLVEDDHCHRARLPAHPLSPSIPDTAFGPFLTPTSSSSTESSGNNRGSLYKTEICGSWIDSGFCRFGPRCQFAHGKEELRPLHLKLEASKTPPTVGRYHQPLNSRPRPDASVAAMPTLAIAQPGKENFPCAHSSLPRSSVWPPNKATEEYINRILYGPSQRRRLPVFAEICPE
ncbi:hypothetical protein QJS10_CPB12g01323 [Acorus calamus]|uniref:C3H1-type domain-containing protein n=1 Tax=Acorus calamus TaxID=4465 RepID=A0AAV9DJH1_ACOCL|nr:hypothetical protein QJS10_CPB12g01323 [Acorus calamus]